LTGVGVFECCNGSKQFPLPHLKAYSSIHSYLSGLLIDQDFVDSTLRAFFMYVRKIRKYCYGVEFIKRTGDTVLANRMKIVASKLSIPWFQYNSKKRATLIPNKLTQEFIDGLFSSRMKKNMRYCRNVLSKNGDIDWRFISGSKVESNCVDRFLQLEHMGWKSSAGSSLLSNSNHEAFFREMVTGFAKNDHVFFTELTVSGCPIASTVNLLSAKAGFAFKIGWDPEFTAASPGVMNEVEFIKNAAELFPHLKYIDSGAEEGSFIEKLWTDHYSLLSGVFVTKSLAKPVVAFVDIYRRIKQQLNKSE
jgi:CelD/BcsL family acetyltransferase involved in cellulose biosynthesis